MTRGCELRVTLPLTLEGVDGFCLQFRSWYTETRYSAEVFTMELLLRETLANAIAHGGRSGNQESFPGTVLCVLRSSEARLLIAVRDSGSGFNWRSANRLPNPENLRAGGRGISIYYYYADRVRFNERGNGVTLVKFFRMKAKEKRK